MLDSCFPRVVREDFSVEGTEYWRNGHAKMRESLGLDDGTAGAKALRGQ